MNKLLNTPLGKTVTMPLKMWQEIIEEVNNKSYPSYSAYIRDILGQRGKLKLNPHQSTLKKQ